MHPRMLIYSLFSVSMMYHLTRVNHIFFRAISCNRRFKNRDKIKKQLPPYTRRRGLVIIKGLYERTGLREAREDRPKLGHVESKLYNNDGLHLREERRCTGRCMRGRTAQGGRSHTEELYKESELQGDNGGTMVRGRLDRRASYVR